MPSCRVTSVITSSRKNFFWFNVIYIWFKILNTSIMSPLKRLYDKVGNFNKRSLFSYDCSDKPGISFVALLCTFSSSSTCFFLYGAQTWLAYSKCGLTKLLYNIYKVSLSRYSKDLLIIPNTVLALFTFSMM